MAERLTIDPASLTVSGQEEDVSKVTSARVSVDLTGATSSISREFDYQLLDADGQEMCIRDSCTAATVAVCVIPLPPRT